MSTHAARLAALRDTLAADDLAGFVVPLTDEHMSEYVGAYAQRLAWLTGFGGSAGSAVVLRDRAAMFTDGRYTLQVRSQVEASLYDYVATPATSIADWLAEHARPGDRIGYDPWLHSRDWVTATAATLQAKGAALVALPANPVDRVWTDRPAPSTARLEIHGLEFAGETSAAKRARIAAWLTERDADAAVVTALDSIAWLFNIRGRDVEHTPVPLAFALVRRDATADLFVDAAKITPEVRAHLGDAVRIADRHAFPAALAALTGAAVVVDPAAAAAVAAALAAAGATVVDARDPCVVSKAVKNPVEIAGAKAAHVRDGAALTRFLAWFAAEAPKGSLDELSAAAKLRQFREATNQLEDLSFDTISGSGPNGAIVHYRVSPATNRAISPETLYLVDSGGQYRDGTTDVTRTLAVGRPTPEMRDRFTRVLQGHIALAGAVFPEGTRGNQLDALARQFLWAAGLDYAHGTGHGVGSYLAVHEGPARIATAAGGYGAMGDEPLRAGMILSNEPGYYKAGEYGIRIENLVLVEPRPIAGAEKPMLGFTTLTLAPIDRALIDVARLSAAERDWIDAYHARVAAEIGPLLDDAARTWLDGATKPLETTA